MTSTSTSVSRRALLEGAAATAAVVAAGAASAQVARAGEPVAEARQVAAGTRFTAYDNPDEIGIMHEASSSEDVDVLVVGTGTTGLMCAMIVAEQDPDAKVLLIDMMPYPGGSTLYAELTEATAGMSEDEAQQAAYQLWSSAGFLNKDPKIFASYYRERGMNSAWLATKHNVEFEADHMYLKNHDGRVMVAGLVSEIENDPTYANVELRLETRATALIMNDPYTCTGAQVRGSDGTYTDVHAKAVMFGTGGITNNAKLLACFTGQEVEERYIEFGVGQKGDACILVEQTAHGMAKDVFPTPMWNNVAGFAERSPLGVAAAMQNSNLYVNQRGERFVNEDFTGTYDFALIGFIPNGHAMGSQGKVFSIMGQNSLAHFEEFGSDRPAYYYYQTPVSLQDDLDLYDDSEDVFHADTIEELAEAIGVPADALAQTVGTYEADAGAGTGDSAFGKDAQYMVPLGDGPYYAFRVRPILIQTNGGVRVDEECRVCDPYGTPVTGLFAGGIAISGVNGESYVGGTSQPICMWSGSKAARYIVRNVLGGTVADDWYGPCEYDGPEGDISKMNLTKPLD